MLDLQYICDNLEPVAENCRNRGVEVDLDRIVALRGRRSELITSGDELRREQKATSSQIPTAESDEAKQALIARGVIGDFRAPDLIRFGITPLYIGIEEVNKAVEILADIMANRHWDRAEFRQRARVT